MPVVNSSPYIIIYSDCGEGISADSEGADRKNARKKIKNPFRKFIAAALNLLWRIGFISIDFIFLTP